MSCGPQDAKALTARARESVNVYTTALMDALESMGGAPSDMSRLFLEDDWPIHELADAHYWLGYLTCAADVLGVEPGQLLTRRAAALREKGARNAGQSSEME